jgi:hypothetical protein
VTSRLGLAALAAFLVADAALVGMALRSTAGGAEGAGPARATSPPASASASATPSGGETTADDAPELAASPLTVGVVAVDGDHAWRFDVGSCRKGGSTLALTDDGGSTWQPRVAPFDTTMRLRVRDDGSAFAIGSDEECAARFRQAPKDVPEWGSEGDVPDAWYRDPKTSTVVGTAEGETAKPCDAAPVVDLSVIDEGAAVLCGDGRVLSSKTGATWEEGPQVPRALAVATTPQRTLLARTLDGCAGVAVVDAADPDTALGCAEVDLTEVKPGTIALSVRGTHAWLLAGPSVLRSSGDLSEWAQAD